MIQEDKSCMHKLKREGAGRAQELETRERERERERNAQYMQWVRRPGDGSAARFASCAMRLSDAARRVTD
jgi:hypothetical protein